MVLGTSPIPVLPCLHRSAPWPQERQDQPRIWVGCFTQWCPVTVQPLVSITALLLLIIQRIRKISQLQKDSSLSVLPTGLWYVIGGRMASFCLFTVHNFGNGLRAAQVLFCCRPLSVGDICADRIIFFFFFFFILFLTIVPLTRAGL